MAIRKDVNDALNNLKKESEKEEKTEEKAPSSKFDGMSVDDLIGVIGDGKETKKAPVKKLKKLQPIKPKETAENSEKPSETAPKKKKIVISGELPDYEALMQSEKEKENKAEAVKKSEPEKKEKPEKKPAEPEKPQDDKKGFFSRVKDLMYIAEDDEDEQDEQEEKPKKSEKTKEKADGNFTIEKLDESVKAVEVSAVTEPEPPKKKAKPEEKKEEGSAEKKKSEKPKQQGTAKKKPENKTAKTENTEKKKSENPEKKKKPETPKAEGGEKKKSAENSQAGNANNPPKKKKKRPPENSGKTSENPVKNTEKKKTEGEKTEKAESTEKKKSAPDKEKTVKKNPENPPKKKTADTKENVSESPQKKKPSESPKQTKPTDTAKKSDNNNGKNIAIGVICIALVVIIISLVSHFGGGKSSEEQIAKAVYPAVIIDINAFDDPSLLPNDQIISSAIWSVVMDSDKLSKYKQRANDMIVIPATDVNQYATDLFGDGIPALTHTTVTNAETKFYYNAESESYNIQVQPDTFTYSPEVKSVSKHGSDYTADVEYIEEHAEWMEKSVAKTARFELTKTNSGYRINSMKVIG